MFFPQIFKALLYVQVVQKTVKVCIFFATKNMHARNSVFSSRHKKLGEPLYTIPFKLKFRGPLKLKNVRSLPLACFLACYRKNKNSLPLSFSFSLFFLFSSLFLSLFLTHTFSKYSAPFYFTITHKDTQMFFSSLTLSFHFSYSLPLPP